MTLLQALESLPPTVNLTGDTLSGTPLEIADRLRQLRTVDEREEQRRDEYGVSSARGRWVVYREQDGRKVDLYTQRDPAEVAAVAIEAASTLEQLCEALRAARGIPGMDYVVDFTDLPTFGGPEPRERQGVWSWDASRLLIGGSLDELSIVARLLPGRRRGRRSSMPDDPVRPSFLIATASVEENADKYGDQDEVLGYSRSVGTAAGLLKIGLHLTRLSPGHRLSYPHAEEKEEEFVFLLEGEVSAFIDGVLYPMKKGDLAAFPAGTGICHTFINNGPDEAVLLVGGERTKPDNRIFYPRNPERLKGMPWSRWWNDAPVRPQGPHDGLPDAARKAPKDPSGKP